VIDCFCTEKVGPSCIVSAASSLRIITHHITRMDLQFLQREVRTVKAQWDCGHICALSKQSQTVVLSYLCLYSSNYYHGFNLKFGTVSVQDKLLIDVLATRKRNQQRISIHATISDLSGVIPVIQKLTALCEELKHRGAKAPLYTMRYCMPSQIPKTKK